MKKLLLLAASAFMLFACSKDDATPEGNLLQQEEGKIYRASFEGTGESGTKVYADDALRLRWNADDRISIFEMVTRNKEYRFTGEDGDTGGEFEQVGSTFGTGNPLPHVYAIYPYYSTTKISDVDQKISLTLPTTQTYKAGSFGIGANPMVAVTDNDFLAFKNICGYLKLKLYGDNISVASVAIQGNNGEPLAGLGKVTADVDAVPSIVMDASATGVVTLNCAEPVLIGSSSSDFTEFIIAVPPTTFTGGFKITVTDALGGVYEKTTTNSTTITRGNLKPMPALKVTPNYAGLNVVFDDDKFKEYCVANFDSGGDNEVSIDEARAATSIDLNSTAYYNTIQSLGGLECFTNLTYLDLGKEDIPSINLSTLVKLENFYCYNSVVQQLDFSNNPELKEIIYQGGRSDQGEPLGQLASVCLPDNPNLEKLWIIESNALTSIDLSHCPALKDLDVHNNQLTALNIDANTALESLSCYNNQLTAIDVSPLTGLTELDCAQNQLTSLDVTALTNLTRLTCSFNQLSTIDLSHNTALTVLYVQQNQLTSLDVSANTELQWLMCSYNKIGSLTIAHFNSLKRVYCGYNPFMTSVSCTYCPALITCDVTDNTALKSLGLSSTKLESITGLKTCTALEDLICQSGKVSTLDVSDMTSLKTLYVAYNHMTSLNVTGCTALEVLSCRDNSLETLDLTTNTALKILYCEDNNLGSLDVKKNQLLEELWAQNNQLTSISFTTSSMVRVSLKTLWVHKNNLTNIDLSKLLKLETLYCHDNQISALSVSNNTNLTKLAAWSTGATGSIERLTKASGQTITYLASDHSTVIDPTQSPWNTSIANL